jgi:4-hydroxythreonine-4-phosphate dehydrogenase
MGDPSGVGPEVIVKALSDKKISSLAHITVIGDYFVINKVKKDLNAKAEFSLTDLSNVPQNNFSYGKNSPQYGRASVEYLGKALQVIKNKEADALVTAPLNKSSVRSAGIKDFEGHTEYMAAATGTKDFSMMFVGKRLKVALVTRHLALKDVPAALTADNVYKAIMLTADSLKKFFGVKSPRIGVAGLNPHAGDGGIFGDEESKAIIPAINRASAAVKKIKGPIPADVIFHEALEGMFDAIVTMYHDQALAPFKMLYFKDGVNLTLGLPFIRTSPDHGTAFDIAGKGIADPSSMKEAIRLASTLHRVGVKYTDAV